VVVYGIFMTATGWPLALLVWGYMLVSFFIASAAKISTYGCSNTMRRGRRATWRGSKAAQLECDGE
jgi:hypothetical protein